MGYDARGAPLDGWFRTGGVPGKRRVTAAGPASVPGGIA